MNTLEYHGHIISQRPSDGYVNATQMCQINGKKVNDWLRNKETEAYTQGVAKITGIPANELIITKQGSIENGGGTWIYPKLAICLGRWISVDFAIWCDDHIKTLIETGKTELTTQPEPPKLNIYARRVQIASKWDIPAGHWCIFHEISLLANKVGEQFEVGEYDLIDGSVVIHWSRYRKEQLWALPTREFYLSFGDKRDFAHATAKAYRDEELYYFRQWLRSDYEADKMVRYLRKKYTGLAVLY